MNPLVLSDVTLPSCPVYAVVTGTDVFPTWDTRYFALWTSEDAAQQFVDQRAAAGIQVAEITYDSDLVELLESLTECGCQAVVVDASAATPVPIGQLIHGMVRTP